MTLNPNRIIKALHRKIHLLRWEYITLGLIALGLILLTAWGLKVTSEVQEPKKTSDAFLRYMRTNDLEEAHKLTSEPFRQAYAREMGNVAKDLRSRIKKNPEIQDYRIARTQEGAYVATVEYEITEENRLPLIVKLIKENDNWRILTINDLP